MIRLIAKTIYKVFIVWILLLVLPVKQVFAQVLKDTLHLNEVEVKSSFSVKNQGFKKVRIDSTLLIPQLSADLSTILTRYSTIFIKSYGEGSLATPSFRGTSSNHTNVEWNGVNINSPMLGMTDLSQIPVSQFDGIEILYGAAGISKTSGAFGGVIDLVTYPTWNDRVNLTIAQSIASFNTFTTTGNVAAGGNKIQSITKFNYKSSINDFVYYNYADSVKITEHQTNSSYDLGGITEELFFKLNRKNFLTTKLWYSKDHKNIPPITTNKNPNHIENLSDEALRSLVEWKYLERNYSLTVRSAVVDQFMHYINDSLNSKHQTYSLVNRVRFNYSGIRNLTVKPGIDINYDWVFTDSYDADKSRSTNGLFCEINYNFLRKTDLSLVLRQDIIDGKFLPFVPSVWNRLSPL